MNIRSYLIAFIIVSFTYFLLALPAKGESSNPFRISLNPPLTSIIVTDENPVSFPLEIENTGKDPIELLFQISPFSPSDEKGGITYIPLDKATTKLFKAISFFENKEKISSLYISPKQKKSILVTIDSLKEIPHADYYFSIILISKDKKDNQSISMIHTGIATHVLLTNQLTQAPHYSISHYKAPFIVNKGPVPFTLTITNSSPRKITIEGSIYITNMFGQTIGKIPLETTNILSKSARTIYAVNSELKRSPLLWNEALLIGPYRATVSLTESTTQETKEQTLFVTGIPFPLLFSLFALFSAGMLIWKRVQQHLR